MQWVRFVSTRSEDRQCWQSIEPVTLIFEQFDDVSLMGGQYINVSRS